MFQVAAVDASDIGDPAYRGTVIFGSSDPLLTLPSPYTFTGADGGYHQFRATLSTLGSQTILASDTQGAIAAGSLQMAVVSGESIPTLGSESYFMAAGLLSACGVFFLLRPDAAA